MTPFCWRANFALSHVTDNIAAATIANADNPESRDVRDVADRQHARQMIYLT